MSAVVAVFVGEYDISHKATFRLELSLLREEQQVVLDMSAVSYIDSTCVTQLVMLADGRGRLGLPPAAIVVQSPSVRRLFDILQLGKLFRVESAIDEVLPKDGSPVRIQYPAAGDESTISQSDIPIVTEDALSPAPEFCYADGATNSRLTTT
jgi:anti-anti-sigma factor